MRYTSLIIVLIVLGISVPAHAQQGGPVVVVADKDAAGSDSFFPLWKSLLPDGKFLPPYGINLVLFDLSGQWDVENFSASVGDNEVASVAGSAHVHPFTYGVRADVWVFPFLNVFVTAGGLKLDVGVTGLDLPLGITGFPPEVIRGDINFDLDFTGSYGGGGLVLMYRWRDIFGSADYSSVWTHLHVGGVRSRGKRATNGHRVFPGGLHCRARAALYRRPLGKEDRSLRGNRGRARQPAADVRSRSPRAGVELPGRDPFADCAQVRAHRGGRIWRENARPRESRLPVLILACAIWRKHARSAALIGGVSLLAEPLVA